MCTVTCVVDRDGAVVLRDIRVMGIPCCAELDNLNDCAVPFLSRAAVNLCWYYVTLKYQRTSQ